ncbi:hypothetical protein, partial [Klebsiella pneumoniae]|uniref:hypothetical protein n=1 Tax=Klebsiella pneumoniae TaxID=573 RepID=UPI0015FF71F9
LHRQPGHDAQQHDDSTPKRKTNILHAIPRSALSQPLEKLLARGASFRQFKKSFAAATALICLKRQARVASLEAPSNTALHRREKDIRAVAHPSVECQKNNKQRGTRCEGSGKQFHRTCQ